MFLIILIIIMNNIQPNNYDMYKEGKLVGDSTYTVNL